MEGMAREDAGRLLRCTFALALVILAMAVNGCIGPRALRGTIIEYDKKHLNAETELILLNVGRLANGTPPHFTLWSQAIASYELTTNAGFTGTLMSHASKNTYAVNLGETSSEKPAITIAPVQGEEYAKRFESPLADKFELLLHLFGGREIQSLLRLMSSGFLSDKPTCNDMIAAGWYPNDPKRARELEPDSSPNSATDRYAMFRRLVSHLQYLSAQGKLRAERIAYYTDLNAPPIAKIDGAAVVSALQNDYRWKKGRDGGTLQKRVPGPLALLNFDPSGDSGIGEDRSKEITDALQPYPKDYVYVELRGDDVNMWPVKGYFHIRGLVQILEFLSGNIKPEPDSAYHEYAVAPDSRTGHITSNFDQTIRIKRATTRPSNAEVVAQYGDGEWLWISGDQNDPQAGWDRHNFMLLYQIFQMSMLDTSKLLTPAVISVGK